MCILDYYLLITNLSDAISDSKEINRSKKASKFVAWGNSMLYIRQIVSHTFRSFNWLTIDFQDNLEQDTCGKFSMGSAAQFLTWFVLQSLSSCPLVE